MEKKTELFLETAISCANQLLENCIGVKEWLDNSDCGGTNGIVRCMIMQYLVDILTICFSQFDEEKTKSELNDKIAELMTCHIKDLTDRICKLTKCIDKKIEIVNDQTSMSQCYELIQTLKEFHTKTADFKEEN